MNPNSHMGASRDLLIQYLPVALISYAYDPEEDTLTLIEANPAANRTLGFDVMARIGEHMEAVFPGVVESNFPEQYRQVAITGEGFSDQQRQYADEVIQGAYDSTTFRSAPLTVTVLFSDVTERIKNEAELRMAKQSLEHSQSITKEALELSGTAVWHWSVQKDEFVVSPEWQTIHGVDRGVLTREQLLPIAHPEDRERIAQRLASAMESGSTYELEHRIIRQDTGAVRIVRARGMTLLDEEGQLVRMVGFARDITDEVEVLSKLERKNSELERYAYAVSHDLRAPLRGIRAALGWLGQVIANPEDGEVQRLMGVIEGRARRMDGMIQSVLEYSRLPESNFDVQAFDLAELAQRVMDDLEVPSLRPVRLPSPSLVTTAPSLHLSRVMKNLVENALRFTDVARPIELRWEMQDGTTLIEVHDSGAGIPDNLRARAFDLFVTLQSRDEIESTGAGLAICKSLVERWGGEIGISDSPLGGACFWFTVPPALGDGSGAPQQSKH